MAKQIGQMQITTSTADNLFAGKNIIDFAIQAPEGTEFSINSATIKIGRLGLYEMFDGIVVTELYIKKYDDNADSILIDYVEEVADNG